MLLPAPMQAADLLRRRQSELGAKLDAHLAQVQDVLNLCWICSEEVSWGSLVQLLCPGLHIQRCPPATTRLLLLFLAMKSRI